MRMGLTNLRGWGRALLLLTAAAAVAALWMGCRPEEEPDVDPYNNGWWVRPESVQDGSLEDGRDHKTYKTVTIGSQTWMAENLNYPVSGGSWCYVDSVSPGDSAANCNDVGRLYSWEAAKTACPNGWRLPDTADWNTLLTVVGGERAARDNLRSKLGWVRGSPGSDNFHFSALPGGLRDTAKAAGYPFHLIGTYGGWWTGTHSYNSGNYNDAYANFIYTGSSYNYYSPEYSYIGWNYDYIIYRVVERSYNKGYGLSVRCIKE